MPMMAVKIPVGCILLVCLLSEAVYSAPLQGVTNSSYDERDQVVPEEPQQKYDGSSPSPALKQPHTGSQVRPDSPAQVQVVPDNTGTKTFSQANAQVRSSPYSESHAKPGLPYKIPLERTQTYLQQDHDGKSQIQLNSQNQVLTGIAHHRRQPETYLPPNQYPGTQPPQNWQKQDRILPDESQMGTQEPIYNQDVVFVSNAYQQHNLSTNIHSATAMPRSFEFSIKVPFNDVPDQNHGKGGIAGSSYPTKNDGQSTYRPTRVEIDTSFNTQSGSDGFSSGSKEGTYGSKISKTDRDETKPTFHLSLSVPLQESPSTNKTEYLTHQQEEVKRWGYEQPAIHIAPTGQANKFPSAQQSQTIALTEQQYAAKHPTPPYIPHAVPNLPVSQYDKNTGGYYDQINPLVSYSTGQGGQMFHDPSIAIDPVPPHYGPPQYANGYSGHTSIPDPGVVKVPVPPSYAPPQYGIDHSGHTAFPDPGVVKNPVPASYAPPQYGIDHSGHTAFPDPGVVKNPVPASYALPQYGKSEQNFFHNPAIVKDQLQNPYSPPQYEKAPIGNYSSGWLRPTGNNDGQGQTQQTTVLDYIPTKITPQQYDYGPSQNKPLNGYHKHELNSIGNYHAVGHKGHTDFPTQISKHPLPVPSAHQYAYGKDPSGHSSYGHQQHGSYTDVLDYSQRRTSTYDGKGQNAQITLDFGNAYPTFTTGQHAQPSIHYPHDLMGAKGQAAGSVPTMVSPPKYGKFPTSHFSTSTNTYQVDTGHSGIRDVKVPFGYHQGQSLHGQLTSDYSLGQIKPPIPVLEPKDYGWSSHNKNVPIKYSTETAHAHYTDQWELSGKTNFHKPSVFIKPEITYASQQVAGESYSGQSQNEQWPSVTLANYSNGQAEPSSPHFGGHSIEKLSYAQRKELGYGHKGTEHRGLLGGSEFETYQGINPGYGFIPTVDKYRYDPQKELYYSDPQPIPGEASYPPYLRKSVASVPNLASPTIYSHDAPTKYSGEVGNLGKNQIIQTVYPGSISMPHVSKTYDPYPEYNVKHGISDQRAVLKESAYPTLGGYGSNHFGKDLSSGPYQSRFPPTLIQNFSKSSLNYYKQPAYDPINETLTHDYHLNTPIDYTVNANKLYFPSYSQHTSTGEKYPQPIYQHSTFGKSDFGQLSKPVNLLSQAPWHSTQTPQTLPTTELHSTSPAYQQSQLGLSPPQSPQSNRRDFINNNNYGGSRPQAQWYDLQPKPSHPQQTYHQSQQAIGDGYAPHFTQPNYQHGSTLSKPFDHSPQASHYPTLSREGQGHGYSGGYIHGSLH